MIARRESLSTYTALTPSVGSGISQDASYFYKFGKLVIGQLCFQFANSTVAKNSVMYSGLPHPVGIVRIICLSGDASDFGIKLWMHSNDTAILTDTAYTNRQAWFSGLAVYITNE